MALKQPFFLAMPTYDQSVSVGEKTSSVWYRFWQGLYQGQPPAAEIPVTLKASPFTFTAPSGGWLNVAGGTISSMKFIRTLSTTIPTAENIIPMSNGDQLVITYSVVPTLTFVPS